MARLKSTYSTYVAAQEATVRIDTRISKAFSSAQKTATVKQLNSVKLMRQRELKGLTGNANF